MATKILARKGTFKLFPTVVTFSNATALDDHSSPTPSTIAKFKNMTITPPEGAVEKVDLIGETAQTVGAGVIETGTFQNSIMDEKPYSNAKIAGTIVVTGAEQLEAMMGGTGTATGSATHHRYMFGDSTSGKARVTTGAVVINIDNTAEEINVGMTNFYLIKIGDLKPSGADGHWEQDVEIECLPNDFALEFKD